MTKLYRFATIVAVLLLLYPASSCRAGTNEEIAALLQFVKKTQCIFIRNGRSYDAAEARRHIAQKYAYFRERIRSAEDFIRYSASQSTITGKPYRVNCNGEEMNSADWLLAELARLRMD